MKRILIALMVMVIGSVALVGCGGTSETVKVSGSSSVSPLMSKLAAAYEKSNKNIRIQITTSDSSTGITDTQSSKNDIGMVSRAVKSNETGVVSTKIADDGVVLIANKEAELSAVTPDEVYSLYASGTAIGAITGAISREEGSGTRDAFDGLIVNSENKKLASLTSFSSAVDIQNSTGYVMTEVVGAKNKIGYISLGSLNDTVKALMYAGVEASAANIKNGTYKLSRPFVVVTKEGATLSEAAKEFLKFIQSDAGQKIVSESGYISVK